MHINRTLSNFYKSSLMIDSAFTFFLSLFPPPPPKATLLKRNITIFDYCNEVSTKNKAII